MGIKFEVIMQFNESASLTRPAWTSEQSTGMFGAYRHKHHIERGKFKLDYCYWVRRAASFLKLLAERRKRNGR